MKASFVLNPSSGGRPTAVGPQGIRIGRAPDNDLVLNDANVSREHALLKVEGPNLVLVDLGSRNGCVVNGQRAGQRTVLNLGDELRIGPFTWRVGRAAPAMPAASPPAPAPRNNTSNKALWPAIIGVGGVLAVCLGLFAWAAVSSNNSNEITDQEAQRRAFASTVFVVAPLLDGEGLSWGSGSIVDENGLVLTNHHVIYDEEAGQIISPLQVYVSANGDPSSAPPTKIYLAQPVRWDANLDLAVIQLVADQAGQPLPKTVKFTPVLLGDSSTVHTNDHIKCFGFPTMGFEDPDNPRLAGITATLTEGIVSGFLGDGPFQQAWLKTDAEINHGNSGGLALDSHWRLIGVPTAGQWKAEAGDMGKIGWVRPINMARDMIQMASDTLYGKSN